MNKRRIRLIVQMLREKHNLNTFPVDVKQFAEASGATLRYDEFDKSLGLSGFAYQKHGSKFIGVNKSEPEERQRFTIAHELGHLYIHKQNAVNYDVGIMLFRDSHSSNGTDIKEIEANNFAAELLMPEDHIRKDIIKMGGIDLEDDESLDGLADKYGVSRQAMTVRLTSLYFVH